MILTATVPFFVVYDAENTVCGMYEAGNADRTNFKLVFGIARNDARHFEGGRVEISRTISSR